VRIPAQLPGVQPAVTNGVTTSYATNWSGYAQTNASGTYVGVADTWTVPTVNTSASGDQYSSDWVGIDGYSGPPDLVQAGTEGDNLNGTAHYDAWTEIIPAAEVPLTGLTIKPGNQIKTVVLETSPNTWLMEVENLTTGKSGSRTVTYDTPGASAEAIHERPEVGSSLATLAKTTNATFTPGLYTTKIPATFTGLPSTTGWTALLASATGNTVYRIFMLNNAGTKIASPSTPTSNKEGFAVADGAKAPSP
jgi:hypothetical protein